MGKRYASIGSWEGHYEYDDGEKARPGEDGSFPHYVYCSKSDKCGLDWYEILCLVLDALDMYDDDNLQDQQLRIRTLSTTWHVHEWVSTLYQERTKEHQVALVVARLFNHYQQSKHTISNEYALWVCATIVHLELFASRRGYIGAMSYIWQLVRHCHNPVPPEVFNSEAWLKGREEAATVIGVTLPELKNATLYRALMETLCNNAYVAHCLRDESFDVEWQARFGFSILRIAAAFASEDLCKMMLDRPEALINQVTPDGLSLIHIAVSHRNAKMVQQLILKPDLDIEAVWTPKEHTAYTRIDSLAFNIYTDWWSLMEERISPFGDFYLRDWTALSMAEFLLDDNPRMGIFEYPETSEQYRCLRLVRQRLAQDAERAAKEISQDSER